MRKIASLNVFGMFLKMSVHYPDASRIQCVAEGKMSLQINIMQTHAQVSPPLTFPCYHDDKMATYERKLPQVCTSHGYATSMQHHKMSQLCASHGTKAAS